MSLLGDGTPEMETTGARREDMTEMKQMSLVKFMAEYGMNRTTTLKLINRKMAPIPAFKLGGQWYVDIPKFEKWREEEHKRQYKYA